MERDWPEKPDLSFRKWAYYCRESVSLLYLPEPTWADVLRRILVAGECPSPVWEWLHWSSSGKHQLTYSLCLSWQTTWKFLLKSPGENFPENNVLVKCICCYFKTPGFLDQPILGKKKKMQWLLTGMVLRAPGFSFELPLGDVCPWGWPGEMTEKQTSVFRDFSPKKLFTHLLYSCS